MAKQPTEFTLKVIEVIQRVPRGRVATYQQIAALAGRPHASRGVSWILNSCAQKYKLPWHRIISSQGRVAFKPGTRNFLLQRRLLERERVQVDRVSGEISLKKFQYRKSVRRSKRQPTMFS